MPPSKSRWLSGRQAHNRRPAATVYLSILRRTAVRVVRRLRRATPQKMQKSPHRIADRPRSLARSGAREATEEEEATGLVSFCRLIFSFFDHRAGGGGGARERVSERVCETAARERESDGRADGRGRWQRRRCWSGFCYVTLVRRRSRGSSSYHARCRGSERGKLWMHARRVLEGETERARRGVGMRQGVTYLWDHPQRPSAKFWMLWTPSNPLIRISHDLSVVSSPSSPQCGRP